MKNRKKTIAWRSLLAVVIIAALGWAGEFIWNGPHGPTHLAVWPYVQPGVRATILDGFDSSRLVWVARGRVATFTVDYGASPAYGSAAQPETVELPETHHAHRYLATLTNLPADARIYYRVRLGEKVLAENNFAARKSATNRIHFIAVGDTVHGRPEERKIAWQAGRQQPDFFLHLGDIAYFTGSVHDYTRNFWPCYNDPGHHSPSSGSPLMGSVPLYVVLGNHDLQYGLDLVKKPDGLAAFYYFFSSGNGPGELSRSLPISGRPEQVAAFRRAAGDAFPGLRFYSFANGPAHFTCLDANAYTDFKDPKLIEWIRNDLLQARAPWKFVVSHEPVFHTAIREYDAQELRLLSPLFEQCGVDVVFSGHNHNYQRTLPMTFEPSVQTNSRHPGWVNGRFTLDGKFDGATNTHAHGIIHVVSGGGGARLFDAALNNHPVLADPDPANWVPYTVRLISDRHSFSDVTLTPHQFNLRQIDDNGSEIDRFQIEK